MHHRLAPKEHHFRHNIFMFYLDLDELDTLSANLPGFSRNRANLYSFRDADHLQPVAPVAGARSTKENITAHLAEQGVALPAGGRIMLLTLPRVLGYVFNPVSFYFCFTADGEPLCALAEVGNTFRELKPYLLRETRPGENFFRLVTPKHFYVSPFLGLELQFDFRLRVPDGRLDLHIDDRASGRRVLRTVLTGRRTALTGARLAWFSLKYPLLTMRVIFLIHWHALLLWWKKIPWHRKAANAHLQRDVFNPHASLQSAAHRPAQTGPESKASP